MSAETPMKLAAPHGEADQQWLAGLLCELEGIDRPSASAGEREAAEWLVGEYAKLGVSARIETEQAHGTYWWPIGIGTALGVAGGLAGRRGNRLAGALLGAVGAGVIASDFPPRPRYMRKLLPKRETFNVVCELGDPEAERTVVLVSHHDAANAGLVFHPGIPDLVSRTGAFQHLDTSPMLMAPVIGGPILAAVAGLAGSRKLATAAAVLSAGSTAAMADIGLRSVVPGANDNGTAVIALLELARRFLADPPEGIRLILLSAGSEESFSEGMKAFGERHFPDLPVDSTFFINMDTIGSPFLTVLRGEGFLKMFEYPQEALILADRTAEEEGIDLMPNLRIRNGTDGLEALAAGYPVVSICSCTEHKQPANYHWPNDIAENVDFDTVESGIRLAEAMTRRLSRDWVSLPAADRVASV
ncbi:MAG: M28 family peptidase [Solirubrobacterales bacterium]|nr:M28 family peptidase [Solirubrobacterales bacterium]